MQNGKNASKSQPDSSALFLLLVATPGLECLVGGVLLLSEADFRSTLIATGKEKVLPKAAEPWRKA